MMGSKQCFYLKAVDFKYASIHNTAYVVILTLRLLMSYIYGAPSKARNANVVYIYIYIYIYGPTFGNAETVSFYLLHNV